LECPNRDVGEAPAASTPQANATGVSAPYFGSETYLDINVNGIKVQCLIDSGCDHSVIPRSRVKEAVLEPVTVDLFAANGT